MEQFTLKDGQFIDQLGFGTYKLNGTKGGACDDGCPEFGLSFIRHRI